MIIFFFYFFFDELYHIEDIQLAFKNICLDKMLSDGYFDMSMYISGRIKKEDMYTKLVAVKSKYAVLYREPFPRPEKASVVWHDKIGQHLHTDIDSAAEIELTYDESCAIVNWVYRVFRTAKEREAFTTELFKQLKEFHHIRNKVRLVKGVVYNEEKVEIHFLSSTSRVNTFISTLKGKGETLFFRGHANPNYILRPSIMRTSRLRQNERNLYHELLINCPEDFEKCPTHLEKLVKMQHYGLPTRLLDVTRNPLVALYFACENQSETYGELVLISAANHDIKYPQSDTVSVLASLPVFSFQKQQEFFRLAKDPTIPNLIFNDHAERLIHEVRLEKPAFQPEINKSDILSNVIVYALKNNNRIIKQDGAFILCGLSDEFGSVEEFRYKEHGKKIVVLIEKKKEILEQLEIFSINRATLFPEIEYVAEYLYSKYAH